MIKKMAFNTVIEGNFPPFAKGHYKISNLEIPEGTTHIFDHESYYKLIGYYTGEDKSIFSLVKKNLEDQLKIEQLLEPVSSGEGIVLPYIEHDLNKLENPRSIITLDGRIFASNDVLRNHKKYIEKTLPERVVRDANKFFSSDGFHKVYDSLTYKE